MHLGHCFRSSLIFLSVFTTTAAQADCPEGQEVFTSCQIEGRNTEVFTCYNDQVATYGYGPIGSAPELFLSEPIETVDFEPWSGLGKAIIESVTFYNDGHSYEVVGGFDRPFSEEEMLAEDWHFGWVEVARNIEKLARLTCVPETVNFGFGGGIFDAMVAAGLTWDDRSKTWVRDQSHPMPTPVLLAQEQNGATEDCLPATEFSLGGVGMGISAQALAKLGAPEDMGKTFVDGRPIDQIAVSGLLIDILEGRVIEAHATSPEWETPAGLRVGLTRGEVVRILGRVPSGALPTADRFTALSCMGDQDDFPLWYAAIAFGQDKRVQSISFTHLAP